jgi:hypothetical protein
MRMMLILFGASAFVYFVTGIKGRFTMRKRLYFALGTYIIVYLITMVLVFTGGNP